MEKFIVTPKEDKSVTMTIRIDRALQEEYNDLAAKTNRSRNELISMALQYALDHMELKDEWWLNESLWILSSGSQLFMRSIARTHLPLLLLPLAVPPSYEHKCSW